ncbi:MAG: hypothetical protein RLZ26_2681 [Pseudomonadota bacterium]|jgi:hypothetical protein
MPRTLATALLLATLAAPASALPPCGPPETVWNDCVGEYRFEDGRTYEGEWRENMLHGSGTLTFPSGATYVGEFRDGWPNGFGTYTFPSGELYVGEYRNGQRHGQGTYFFASGATYVGEYRNGMRDGFGTYTFPNGEIYVGEHRDDQRYGYGTQKFPDGAIYEGEFREDKYHGRGTLYDPYGRILQQGTWIAGELVKPDGNFSSNQVQLGDLVVASTGSAFAVSAVGHLITNEHVIANGRQIKVRYDDRYFPAKVVKSDQLNDIALIFAGFKPPRILALAPEGPALLQDIYAAGFPFGATFGGSVKVTRGIVSSLSGLGSDVSQVQIDAALQPGNSGGPVLDTRGNVMGVAVAKLDAEAIIETFGAIPENTNFAVRVRAH